MIGMVAGILAFPGNDGRGPQQKCAIKPQFYPHIVDMEFWLRLRDGGFGVCFICGVEPGACVFVKGLGFHSECLQINMRDSASCCISSWFPLVVSALRTSP